LRAVKLNSRLTMYDEADVIRIAQGRVETVLVSSSPAPASITRTTNGQFAALP